jgi:hypothetical protein
LCRRTTWCQEVVFAVNTYSVTKARTERITVYDSRLRYDSLGFLVHGARDCKEPGIFVAFEETSRRIALNAGGFGWNIAELQRKKALYFMDAQPSADLVHCGSFDLGGVLAALHHEAKVIRARRNVFDAIDIMLALLPDPAAKRREVYRKGICGCRSIAAPVSTRMKHRS